MPEMMWAQLMSPLRYQGGCEPVKADDPDFAVRSPFVKDADKIIYSSAFRRLQDKTQVHTFPGSDYVRTRLTHSLEVSAVGRSLGIAVGRHLKEVHENDPNNKPVPPDPADLGNVVAAASLAHDIGNPPFGHAGEEAIRHWFAQSSQAPLFDGLEPEQRADFKYFEGNAQGFRIITRLQAWRNQGGLRLTCATLGAFQKYPNASLITARETKKKIPPLKKKFGYFQEDREAIEKVAQTLGLVRLNEDKNNPRWCRHPLALLVEAADDICNMIADIEDGYKYKKIEYDIVYDLLWQIATGPGLGKPLNAEMEKSKCTYCPDEKIVYLRAQSIGALIWQAVEEYKRYEDEIMRGTFDGPLLDKVPSFSVLEEINRVCEKKLFNDPSTLRAELAGFEVIRGVLEIYAEALKAWEDLAWATDELPSRDRKAIELLKKSGEIPEDRYGWLLGVTDYVSGMTDNFAVDLYRRLKGITVGGTFR